MKNNELTFIIAFQILIFFLIPFISDFWIVSLFITVLTSLYVVLFSDKWIKYFYPVFVMSCFIIVIRIFGINDFLDLKELFFATSGIGCSMGCVVSAIGLIFKN